MHICQRRKVGAELSFSATAKVADRLFGHPCARMGVQKLRRPRFFLGFHESVACVVCISRAEGPLPERQPLMSAFPRLRLPRIYPPAWAAVLLVLSAGCGGGGAAPEKTWGR